MDKKLLIWDIILSVLLVLMGIWLLLINFEVTMVRLAYPVIQEELDDHRRVINEHADFLDEFRLIINEHSEALNLLIFWGQ